MAEPTIRNVSTADNVVRRELLLRHVSWGSIILGLVIALAIQILLGLLGIGLGFSIFDPHDPAAGIGAWSIATSIYMVVTQIIALFIGGYVAAHLAPARTDGTAILHGLSIWALVTIAVVWLGSTAVGAAVSGAGGAISGIASATGKAVEAVVPDNFQFPDLSYQALPDPVRQTLQRNNITPERLRSELQNAYRQTVSQQEEQRLMNELKQTIGAILKNPADATEEINQAVDQMFGENGILNKSDLDQMQNTLQQSLNLSDQEAQQIRTQLEQSIDQARKALSGSVQQAQQRALKAATTVTDRIGSIALWLFFASVLGLVAAVIGGRVGEVKAGI